MPTDPATFSTGGPLAILLGVAFFLYLAFREIKRLRAIELDDALRALDEEKKARKTEVQELKDDIHNLQTEVARLRDQLFDDGRREHEKRETVARENAMLRTIIAELGGKIPSEEP